MFKKLLIVASAVLLTAGCVDHVTVSQQQLAMQIDAGSGKPTGSIYRGKTLKIDNFCGSTTACDKALVLTVPAHNHPVPGEYAMPLSNDMDLTLNLDFRVKFDTSGTEAELKQRIIKAASRYKMQVQGSPSSVQELHIDIATMAALDLNPAIVKTNIRPILANYTLETAFRNIGSGGSILYGGKDPSGEEISGILQGVRDYLASIDSPLIIETAAVRNIAMPEEIVNRKKENEGLAQEEEMHAKRLNMKERRRIKEHLLNMRQAADELEVLAMQLPVLQNPSVIAYKWTQVAQTFAEAGLPFAITPEMLSMGEGGSVAIQDLEERIQSLRQKADQAESSAYAQCLDAGTKTVEECNKLNEN